jgi:transketolase
VFIPAEMPFEIGKAQVLVEGTDVTLDRLWPPGMACPSGSRTAGLEGIRAEVINMHTIKPLDDEAVLRSVSAQDAW